MLQERINRVINNHQLSCGHTDHYLYVLQGFTPVLEHYTVPVDPFDASLLKTKVNMYVTFEEALLFEPSQIQALRDQEYDLWIVAFNFFPHVFISNTSASDYASIERHEDVYVVTYPELPWVETRKTISIFNTMNPLIGVVQDSHRRDSFNEYYDIYKQLQ